MQRGATGYMLRPVDSTPKGIGASLAHGRQDGRLTHCLAPWTLPGVGNIPSLFDFMGKDGSVCKINVLLCPTETVGV